MEDKVVLIPNKLSGVDQSEHSLQGIHQHDINHAPFVLNLLVKYLNTNFRGEC